jgi:thiamine biosynthesis lipoprotein
MDDRRTFSITRRDFLALVSGAALPLVSCRTRKPAPPAVDTPGDYFWSGIGFGIDMSMEIYGVTAAEGERLGAGCEQDIRALEQAFSLYQEDSELSILNRERVLSRPSPVFRELLELATAMHARTLGFYQPAVHGAWLWLEQRGTTSGLDEDPAWREQCAACDLKFVDATPDEGIRLTHPLTKLSMNAIAQGFLADRVAARLRSAGVVSALLQLGESYAIGRHPEGRLWNLAVSGTPGDGETGIVGEIQFSDAGLAVSAQDDTRRLIDPVAGTVHQTASVAAVVSKEGAAVADAFATAFAVAPENRWSELARKLGEADGSQVHIWIGNHLRFTAP